MANGMPVVVIDPTTDQPSQASQLAPGAQVLASSGNVANAAAVATLPAAAGKTTYITGLDITAAGATAGSVVVVTVTGLLGGTISFVFVAPTGALLPGNALNVQFLYPLAASAVNTTIVVTLPALGAGNTNAVVNAYGFQR